MPMFRQALLTAAAAILLMPVERASAAAVVLYETPLGATTEYSVQNLSGSTAQPFDITLFAVSTTGNSPTTTAAGWNAQALTPADWVTRMDLSAGGTIPIFGATWQEYTGLTWAQAFPAGALQANGYYTNYGYNVNTGQIASIPSDPCFPGDPIKGGFFYLGSPGSEFLAVGLPAGTFQGTAGNLPFYAGVATPVPLPPTLGLFATALALLGRRRRADR